MLNLNHTSLHKVKVHATQTYPEECCGVLLGTERNGERQVCDVLEIRNTKDDQRTRRYLISPEDYRQAEVFAANEGVQVLGLYHSHPDHPAQPSQFDLDHALPWFSYVIVSVENNVAGTIRSWRLRDDRSAFDEEELVILDGEFTHTIRQEG